jgi:hypothetical protein
MQDLKGSMNGRASALRKYAQKNFGLTKKPKAPTAFAAWVEENASTVLK